MDWSLSFLYSIRPIAPLALRAAVGVAFLIHSIDKIRPEGAVDWGQAFAERGAANGIAPAALLYVAAWTEFFGGAALLFGFLTRWAAIGLLVVMGYAIFKVHAGDPYKAKELAFAYSAALIALLGTGPGGFSIDRAIFGKKAVPE